MTPPNGTIIDLSLTTAYVPMSLDIEVDESVLTRAPVDTPKPSSKPDYATSPSSISTPITASTYTLSPSAALSAAFTSSYKRHNITE